MEEAQEIYLAEMNEYDVLYKKMNPVKSSNSLWAKIAKLFKK